MIRRTIPVFGAAVAALVCASTLQAAIISQTFYMNQSNTLSDGVNYGVVKIDADADAGTVKFEVTAPYIYNAPVGSKSNFGFLTFYLNTNSLVSKTDFTVESPDNWSFDQDKHNVSEFGRYGFEFKANQGNGSLDPLKFTFNLINKNNATIENFANFNGPDPKMPPRFYFAGHIHDFTLTDNVNSHFVAGSVPEPSTIVLWSLVGVGGLAFARRFRRK